MGNCRSSLALVGRYSFEETRILLRKNLKIESLVSLLMSFLPLGVGQSIPVCCLSQDSKKEFECPSPCILFGPAVWHFYADKYRSPGILLYAAERWDAVPVNQRDLFSKAFKDLFREQDIALHPSCLQGFEQLFRNLPLRPGDARNLNLHMTSFWFPLLERQRQQRTERELRLTAFCPLLLQLCCSMSNSPWIRKAVKRSILDFVYTITRGEAASLFAEWPIRMHIFTEMAIVEGIIAHGEGRQNTEF